MSARRPSFGELRAAAERQWAVDVAALRASRVDLNSLVAVAVDSSATHDRAPVAFVCRADQAFERLSAVDPELARFAARALASPTPLTLACRRSANGMLDVEACSAAPGALGAGSLGR